jgi:AraC-like DNA-binding protein
MPPINIVGPTTSAPMTKHSRAPRATHIELPSSWFEPGIHSAYVQIFAKFIVARGLPVPLPVTGPPRLLAIVDVLSFLEALDVVDRPESGIELGLAIPAAAHGAMGLSALSSETLWDAMVSLARYGPIRNSLFNHRAFQQGDAAIIECLPRLNLGRYEKFIGYATVLAVFNVLKAISAEVASEGTRLTFPWKMPPWPQTSAIAATAFDFNEGFLGIRVPLKTAMQPSQSADPDLCKRLKMAGEEELTKSMGSTAAKVRHVLHQKAPLWPSLQEVADKLAMSKRTLIRKLELESVSYQVLLDEVRTELICWFLQKSDMQLSDIAERAGFSDQASFTRNFRRLQGCTPGQYRMRTPQ